jgi:CO/xanthine dehydrogenase FAD-binding subunit
MAGGTAAICENSAGRYPDRIVDLRAAEELSLISRSERWLDIGATLSISRIIGVGRHVIPPALHTALEGIGGPPLRNLATLGGNVCLASPFSDSLTPLFALEARVETRGRTGSRWLPISEFTSAQGKPTLGAGEIVTRIRVPLQPWDDQFFRKVSAKQSPSVSLLSMCALARRQKNVLSELRLAISGVYPLIEGGPMVHRNRGLEVALTGHRLPLTPRAVAHFERALKTSLIPIEDKRPAQGYQIRTATRLFGSFLRKLGRG